MNPYLQDADFTLYNGDALEVLRELPDESVHCCLTSPPFFGLRDYGTGTWEGGDAGCDHRKDDTGSSSATSRLRLDGREHIGAYANEKDTRKPYREVCGKCGARRVDRQIGLESTPEEWVASLVAVFEEVRRVLRKDGTLWVECGDSYGAPNSGGATPRVDGGTPYRIDGLPTRPPYKPKDLIGQPFLLAQALRAPRYQGKIRDERDRVWLAAMLEAEGCMFIHRRKAGTDNGQGYKRKEDTFSAALEIANTDHIIVERCREIANGLGSISEQTEGRRRPIYRWSLRARQAQAVVEELYPHLIAKQHEARILLSAPNSGTRGTEAHAALKNLHQGGIPTLDFKPPEPMFRPGWYWRNTCIWAKPNPMPESVRDRFTVSHSYVLLFSKSPRYFFDAEAVREPHEGPMTERRLRVGVERQGPKMDARDGTRTESAWQANGLNPAGRNARSVWTIATQPLPWEHYAAFPEALAERCIKAGTSERGCCPECGAPWVRETAPIGEYAGKSEHHPARRALDPLRFASYLRERRASAGLSMAEIDRQLGTNTAYSWWEGRATGTQLPTPELYAALKPILVMDDRFDEFFAVIPKTEDGWISGATDPLVEGNRKQGRSQTATFETTGWRPSCECVGLDDVFHPPIPCTVLDPFLGSGTTALTARRLGRKCIGVELNEKYCDLAAERTKQLSLLGGYESEAERVAPPPGVPPAPVRHAEGTPRNDGERWRAHDGGVAPRVNAKKPPPQGASLLGEDLSPNERAEASA